MKTKINHKNKETTGRLLELINIFGSGKPSAFCKKAGIPQSTFQYYINGRLPHAEHLIRIHDKFGVSLNWLLTGKGEMLDDTISSSSKHDINHTIVADSFCESVKMLTLIYDKNRNLFETVVKYLKQAVGMLDIEEGLKDSDKKQ